LFENAVEIALVGIPYGGNDLFDGHVALTQIILCHIQAESLQDLRKVAVCIFFQEQ
jgi:hypothetical protein